jgi:hypothetical protein
VGRRKSALSTPKELLETLKPVLDEYLVQKVAVEKQITQQGMIPRHFCKRCARRSILEVQKLLEEHNKAVPDLVHWIDRNDIRYLNSDGKSVRFSSSMEEVEGVKGSSLLLVGSTSEPSRYDYAIPTSRLKKKPFAPILRNEFHSLETCGHLDRDSLQNSRVALLTMSSRYLSLHERVHEVLKKPREKELRLLCSECYGRIESTGCEDGITKRGGFVFSYTCPMKQVLLQDLLAKNKIAFTAPKLEHWYNRSTTMYLGDLEVLVTDEKNVDDHVEKLDPKCILAFGTQKSLFSYIRLGINVIIFDDSVEATQRYFLFDRDKRVDHSIENIVKAVVNKLDIYAGKMRGKEHDRLVGAFQKIGRDLGFVTQQELGVKGTLLDAAWLDRQGVVHVAIEVETSSSWKKDIVSTWEAQPKLSIILVHDKTDRGIKNLTQYALLLVMPHKLLLVNYALKRAYLVEKQEVLKCYDLEKKAEIAETDVLEL